MTLLPIVERELRLKARSPRTYMARCSMAAIVVFLCLGVILLSFSAGRTPTQIGQDLFWACNAVIFTCCVCSGPILASDCLSEERRQGTLGLLFLTDLWSIDVVLGKFVAASLPMFYGTAAAIPVLAMPFFLGGISGHEFWRMTATHLIACLLSLSVSVCISAICFERRNAFGAAVGAVSMLAFGPLLSTCGVIESTSLWSQILSSLPSSGTQFLSVRGPYAVSAKPFWMTSLFLVLMSAMFLALACVLIRWTWRESAACHRGYAHRISLWRSSRWLHDWNRQRQRAILNEDPAAWLAGRLTVDRRVMYAFWIVAAFVWCIGYRILQLNGVSSLLVLVLAYALHGLVKCWIAWEASRRLAEDRSNGTLELLLTTPLTSRWILAGWMKGLRWRFLWPCLAILTLDMHLGVASGSGEGLLALLGMAGLFAADSYTLCWVGFAMSCRAKSSVRAFLNSIILVLVGPWVIQCVILIVWELTADQNPLESSPIAVATIGFLVGYVADFAICVWGIKQLSHGLRKSIESETTRSANKLSVLAWTRQRKLTS